MAHKFGPQAETWLQEMANRTDPLSPASLATFRVHINRLKKFIPADTLLQTIHNGFLKDLASKMNHFAPKTARETLSTLCLIVGSVLDPVTLESVYKRQWNWRAIGLRKIKNQRQPTVSAEKIEKAIAGATSFREQLLYAVLAGTGLRRSEIRSVRVGPTSDLNLSCWLPDESVIRVRSTMLGDAELSGHTKTDSSRRDVDISQKLNDAIVKFVLDEKIVPGMFLFQSKNGRPISAGVIAKKARRRGLPGLHSARRFRITHLRSVPVIEDLIRFWAGHSADGITSRYSKVSGDLALRRSWARRAGLGFSLEKVGHPAKAKLGRPYKPKKPTPVASGRIAPSNPEMSEPQAAQPEPVQANLPEREPEQTPLSVHTSVQVEKPVTIDDLERAKAEFLALGGKLEHSFSRA